MKESVLLSVSAIAEAFAAGKKLLLCGNGGSCADCDHIAGELLKGFLKRRPVPDTLKEMLSELYGEEGARIAVSDAATGIAFCLSALEGAAVNVLVNTKYMKNREYADQINAEVETVRSACRQKAESVYSSVYEGLLK